MLVLERQARGRLAHHHRTDAYGRGTDLKFAHDRFFDAQARDNHARAWPPFFDALGVYLRT
jgi:hypothetical protein